MKVAIATKNNMVTNHFGHCDYFIVYNIENNEIISSSLIKNPPHQKGYLPQFLKENGVDVVIADGIGKMAVDLLKDHNIDCFVGVSGASSDVIKRFIDGDIESMGEPCTDHHH